ncbi:hypothetical protein BDR06DRAFT_956844 [Suillus hirtellus]|nr:hypothetical protein BDR06DRAFT_956844 [Suillus hirtellus]
MSVSPTRRLKVRFYSMGSKPPRAAALACELLTVNTDRGPRAHPDTPEDNTDGSASNMLVLLDLVPLLPEPSATYAASFGLR